MSEQNAQPRDREDNAGETPDEPQAAVADAQPNGAHGVDTTGETGEKAAEPSAAKAEEKATEPAGELSEPEVAKAEGEPAAKAEEDVTEPAEDPAEPQVAKAEGKAKPSAGGGEGRGTLRERRAARAATAARPWSVLRRIVVTLAIYLVLMGILVGLSSVTTVDWGSNSGVQVISTVGNDTSVAFDESGVTGDLPARGTYEVETISDYIDLVQPDTGAVQTAHILIRLPAGISDSGDTKDARAAQGVDSSALSALPSRLPGAVYMHGAGYGTADNSFGDVSEDLASAGFVTLTVDKPVWGTNDVTRDYPGSASAYDQCVEYLRALPYVDPDGVGIYATSESAWIAPYVIQQDSHIAFQVLLSPLVFNPRDAVAFFVTQDFSIVGANAGYTRILRRVFSGDFTVLGITNGDFDALLDCAYSVPTFVAYGSKDVMTPQAEGASMILSMAHAAGNWDVTFRNYPMANHVLRIGDESEPGTALVDHYQNDYVDWAVGVTRGLEQTSPRVTGTDISQAIPVPTDLTPHRGGTIYALVIHVLQILTLLALVVCLVIALIRHHVNRHRKAGPAAGLDTSFKRLLTVSLVATFGSLLLFFAGLGQVVYRLVQLVWGAAPTEPGMIAWSWYVVRALCAIVVLVWAAVFASGIEQVQLHGRWHLPGEARRPQAGEVAGQRMFAATKLGRLIAILAMVEILLILLVLAFWGVFLYW